MAGGTVKYRHLSRNSAHRQALLRNLVTSLVKHESIQTTWHKAKEAQRVAERLITLAKRNNETARRKAQATLFTPEQLTPKLFGELAARYANRPGGYTRVLRTEPKSTYDQGASALLQLVDGPRDMRYAVTAAAVARDRAIGRPSNQLTLRNRSKVLRYRGEGADRQFNDMVSRMSGLGLSADPGKKNGGSQASDDAPVPLEAGEGAHDASVNAQLDTRKPRAGTPAGRETR